jgi:hypothetical protein
MALGMERNGINRRSMIRRLNHSLARLYGSNGNAERILLGLRMGLIASLMTKA